MRIAAIDIGTNTALLLIADINNNGIIFPVADLLETPRLGEGSHKSGFISVNAIDRTIGILNKYKYLASAHSVDSTVLCGTSALREAGNRQEVLDSIRTRTGYEVDVLEGSEEASLTFFGTLGSVQLSADRAAVIDIGGGSTEIAYYSKSRLITHSYPLGAVRLTDRFLKDDPPGSDQMTEAAKHIREHFNESGLKDMHGKILIGAAGTPTTLACLDQNLADFDHTAVDGYIISLDRIRHWQRRLSSLSSAEIRTLSRSTAGREDILTIGTALLYEFMKKWNFPDITVSVRGLRYGLLLREWERRK